MNKHSVTQQMFTDHFSVGDTFWEAAVKKPNSIIRILELIFSMGKGGQKINKQDMYIHFIVFYKFLYEQVIHNIISIKANVSGKGCFSQYNQFSVICHA